MSMAVGLAASAISLCVGIAYGAIAGYLGGRTDHFMMRVIEILSGLPLVFFVIFLTVILGRSQYVLFLSIGAVGWLTMARIVRGQTLSIRQREFIEAAVASGAGTMRIIAKHVLPNLMGTVVVYATLTVPQIILFESFLSFLGLGVQEPHSSLGTLIAEGAGEMEAAPWMLLVPGGILARAAAVPEHFGRWTARRVGRQGDRLLMHRPAVENLSVQFAPRPRDDRRRARRLAGRTGRRVRGHRRRIRIRQDPDVHGCHGTAGAGRAYRRQRAIRRARKFWA